MASAPKFRPYFTAAQLQEIIRCCKISSQDRSLLVYLESFHLKIHHDVIAPSHIPAPTMEDRLGISPPPVYAISPEDLYAHWRKSPETLTPSELSRVQQYRYENDLMLMEEITAYEDKILAGD